MGAKLKLLARISGVWLLVIAWWGWLLLDPFQEHTSLVKQTLPFFFSLSIFLIYLSSVEKPGLKRPDKPMLLWMLPIFILSLFCIFLIRIHSSPALILLTISLAVLLSLGLIGFRPLGKACLTFALALIALTVASVLVWILRGKPHLLSQFFAQQASVILHAFGYNAAAFDNILFFQEKKVYYDVIKSGLFLTSGFYLGFVALVIGAKAGAKNKAWALITGFIIHYAYFILRLLYVAAISQPIIEAGLDPFNKYLWKWALVSYVPLIPVCFLLLNKYSMSDTLHFELKPIKLDKQIIYWILLILLSSLFMTTSYFFYGFTKRDKITIVVDEIHSRWESTLIDFNKNILGTLAENSYHSFLDYVSRFYPAYVLTDEDIKVSIDRVATIKADKIDSKLLQSFKGRVILVLKCVTKPYSKDEINTIVQFVKNGGSLFLIGDHTDVYFMNKNLNELSREFGIVYEQNSVYFVDGGWIITGREDYIQHPITHHLDKFIWATNSSLKLSGPAFPVVFSPLASFADQVNYFNDFFFGNTKVDSYDIYGSYTVIGAAQYGKGRVVAFTDSTCFNNFLMFTVGRRELLTGIFQWLGSRGASNPFLPLAILTLAGSVFLLVVKRPSLWFLLYVFLISCPIGSASGYLIALHLNNTISAQPEPIYPLPRQVLVDASHKPAHCMMFGSSEQIMGNNSYEGFFYDLGRIELYSQINYKHKLSEHLLDDYSLLVLVSPGEKFLKSELDAISKFVYKGGGLLLIEGPNKDTTINSVASLFGMRFRRDPDLSLNLKIFRSISEKSVSQEPTFVTPTHVDGGTPLFILDNTPIVSYAKHGKGLVVALGDDNLFTKNNVGYYQPSMMNLKCNLAEALSSSNEAMLKKIDWKYLGFKNIK
jgi:hypothetical protein